MTDQEMLDIEADLDAIPVKKSRPIPTVTLDEIYVELMKDGKFGRRSAGLQSKKVFCWVAMKLGHHPQMIGDSCGLDRTSVIHHFNDMEGFIELALTGKKMIDDTNTNSTDR